VFFNVVSDVGGGLVKEGVGLNDVITKRQITRRESMDEASDTT